MMRVEGYSFVGKCECCGKEAILARIMPVYYYSYVFVCGGCYYELLEGVR